MHEQIWNQVLNLLEKEILPLNFNLWLSPIKAIEFNNGKLILSTNSEAAKVFFEKNYKSKIEEILENITCTKVFIEFSDQHPADLDEIPKSANSEITSNLFGSKSLQSTSSKQRLSSKQTFEDFFIGKENSFAYHAAIQTIENPGKWNPLYFYGPGGTGKSHLLKAIAWALHDLGKKTLYLRGFEFYNLYINSILHKNYESFYSRFLNLDVLILDEVDFLGGKDKTGDTFLHIFNTLYDAGSQIILSSQKSPDQITGFGEELLSRLTWGLIIPFSSPGQEIRFGIIRKLQKELVSNAISDELTQYISSMPVSNIRHLEGIVRRLVATYEITGTQITKEVVDSEVSRFVDFDSKETPIEKIRKTVCKHFNITPKDLESKERSLRIARPRQIAMYLAKKHTNYTYPAIGSSFGNKKHTTVMNACKKIEELKQKDQVFRRELEQLEMEFSDFE